MSDIFQRKLKGLRKEIDNIDKTLVRHLAKRMTVSKKMGKLKKTHRVPILQKGRWNLVIKSRLQYAKGLKLDTKIVDRIFREIHKGSVAVQKRVKGTK